MAATKQSDERVAYRPQTLAGDLDDLSTVRFQGVHCRQCGVALLGIRARCENCASADLEGRAFAISGSVYSFTLQRYPPPAPYTFRGKWTPRPVAWVDIDDGPRILTPLDCAEGEVGIGTRVGFSFVVGWRDQAGRDVVAFTARPCGEGQG